ncbi:E3 binding domain-containing protein [Streptobacillus moniliformis]|nr:E3 binding domain-containing protein [Streptobacillus moniliformis]
MASYKAEASIKIYPVARRIAEDNSINWQELKGSGIRGKIMKSDILALL